MKKITYIILACLCCIVTGCKDGDWDNPGKTTADTFGNNALEETNVVTIKELKDMYKSTLAQQYGLTEIGKDLKIKGRVLGNDIEGNIYSKVVIDDGTGAIIISVGVGGLFAYLPVGQEILVDLSKLWIGTYGYQPQLGVYYVSPSGNTSVGRISRALWNQSFKLLGAPDASKIKPIEFDKTKVKDAAYMSENVGRLMVIRDVTLKTEEEEKEEKEGNKPPRVWAAEADASNNQTEVNQGIIGLSKVYVRTSTYADFANSVIPFGKLDITGIFTIYGKKSIQDSDWQIYLRTEADVVKK